MTTQNLWVDFYFRRKRQSTKNHRIKPETHTHTRAITLELNHNLIYEGDTRAQHSDRKNSTKKKRKSVKARTLAQIQIKLFHLFLKNSLFQPH